MGIVSFFSISFVLTTLWNRNAPETHTFNAPSDDSARTFYALEELRMICLALRSYLSGEYVLYSRGKERKGEHSGANKSQQGQPSNVVTPQTRAPLSSGISKFFPTLTQSQIDALQHLVSQLELVSVTAPELVEAIQDVLERFYMPENTFAMYDNPYISLVVAFLCVRAVHPDGGFIEPILITHNITLIQFGIRHALFVHAGRLWKDMDENSTQEGLAGQDWFVYVFGEFLTPSPSLTVGNILIYSARLKQQSLHGQLKLRTPLWLMFAIGCGS